MKHLFKKYYFLLAIVAVHIVFFLLALHYKRIYMGDSYEHVYMALNIKDHFLFYSANAALPLQAKYFTLRPPVYSLFLLIVYWVTVNNWVVIVLQNILSVFNIWYLHRMLLRLGYERRYDPLLLVFVILYPAQFIFADTIAPDILLQTFVLIYCRHFIEFVASKRSYHAWIMSLALLLGMFTKPILYPFTLIHLIMLLWFGRRSVIRTAVLPILAVITVIALYNGWNEERTGKFHFTSIQPFNAMYYNVRLYEEHRLGKEQAKLFMQHEKEVMEGQPTFRDWYDYGNRSSMNILKEHFPDYMLFHLKYSALFLIYPGRNEIDLFTGKMTYGRFYQKTDKRILEVLKDLPPERWIAYFTANFSIIAMLIILIFNVVKTFGLLLFLFRQQIAVAYRIFILLMIGYFAFLTGPLVNTRYCLPVSLIGIGCGVVGLQSLFKTKTKLAG